MWGRWEEVDRVFEAALDVQPEKRETFLAQACGDDADLLGTVRELLAISDAPDRRLEAPGAFLMRDAWSEDVVAERPPARSGQRVGRYRILRELGRGGMATVYEAERADGLFDQRVAIKLLRRGLDTDEVVRRFLVERHILSGLEHPRIARLLDGGATDFGRPFLVLERVDGEPITRWADNRRLSVRARLELFLQVADAVQFAHRRLIVHRDLKPSNILVDEGGNAKLLDFGIAKLLDATEGDATEPLTRTGIRPLTPEYASPEQLRGERVTTASDVYQLGVLLYMLLSGRRPFSGRGEELESSITAGRLVRPSDATAGAADARESSEPMASVTAITSPADISAARATTPDGLRRALRGDLDAIILKALRAEPEERYGSAEALAEDIVLFLAGLPVRARRGSAVYHARKFVRRHWVSVAAAAAIVLVSTGSAVALAHERDNAQEAALTAEREAETARRVTEFMTGLFQSGDPTAALPDTVTVLGILHAGAERIRSELEDRPGVRAALLLAMGRAFTGLGRFERADTLLMESLTLHRGIYGDQPGRVADVLNAIGKNHRERRDFKAADRYFHEELSTRTASGTIADTSLARMLQFLSGTRRDVGDVDSALVLARSAVGIRRAVADTGTAAYVGALGDLAYVLRAAGELDSAEVVYREVVRRKEQLFGPNHYQLGVTYNNLAFLLTTRGDDAAAEPAYRASLRIVRAVLGEGHPMTLMVQSNLAAALERQEKFAETEAIRRERVAAAERQWPAGHWRVGSALEGYGTFLLRRDRPAEAIDPLRAALSSYTETIGAQHTWTAAARAWYAIALLLVGRNMEADTLLDTCYQVLSRAENLDADVRGSVRRAAQYLEARDHAARAARFRALIPTEDGS